METKRGKRKPANNINECEITFEQLQLMLQEMSKRLDSLEHSVCFQYSKGRGNPIINDEISDHLKLEVICAPLFSVTPNPTTVELNRLVRDNQLKFQCDQKELKVSVRKWFRLKRQEAGRRLAPVYHSEIEPFLTDSNTIEKVSETIRLKGELFCRIRDLSQLNFANQDALADFICDKIMSFRKSNVDSESVS